MLETRVIPCLLLRNRSLVKTIKFKAPKYVGEPINTVRIYNEKEVDELIFLDITASKENKNIQFSLVEEIAEECFMPFTYGGGIRSMEDVKQLFTLGVEKIAVNAYAYEDPFFIRRIADDYGSQSVVVGIDVKKNWLGKYRLSSYGATKIESFSPVEHARRMQELGAGEILLTSINNDGVMNGYDLQLIEKISQAVSIPVIASGGAGELADFSKAVEAGASAVAAGSMVVFQGKNRAVLTSFPKRVELKEHLK